MQNCWVDIRAYMDTAVYSINESSSIQKSYRYLYTFFPDYYSKLFLDFSEPWA